MSQKIYVGNMSYNTNNQNLADCFAAFGEVVSASVITDRYTGQSKGFGFVEMADEQAASAAIAALNGSDMNGRNIRVSIAEDKPRNARPRFNNNNRY